MAEGRAIRSTFAVFLLSGLFALSLWATAGARLDRADFTYNNGGEVTTLDPAAVSGIPEGRVMNSIYEGLTSRDPETAAPIPGVASSWEISDDGRHYTFHLRPDARWSNGEPVTAHDFAWSWKRLLAPEKAAEYVYQLWYVRNARAFTLAPPDLLYTAPAVGIWCAEQPDGTVRLGLHAFVEGDREALWEPAPGEGDAIALRIEGELRRAPLAGTVLAVNEEAPRQLGELLDDPRGPYGERWLLHVQPAPGALDEAKQRGRLLDAADARDELFWPAVGVRATDDRTLEVELEAPTPFFLDLTAFYPTYPVHRATIERMQMRYPDTWEVAWVRPENLVTNGPYVVASRRINDRLRLRKNPHYWDADRVAFRTIDVLAVESYTTMLNMYLTGELDWIERVAPNMIKRLLPREDFNPAPYLGTYFYRVNVTRPPFDDVRVRRALALTIDRRAIVDKITKKGEGPSFSFCPPGLAGYERPEMKHAPLDPDLANYDEAYAADCAEAAALMAAAGFGPDGEKPPTIELHYNTSESHRDVAEVVAAAWQRVLGVNVKLLSQEWKVYLDTQETLGYDVSRSAWIQDYPDPNTFIDMLLSGGANNRTGWANARFDRLVLDAAREPDPARRLDLLREAEAIVLDELPILPIYSYVTQNLVNPRLGGFFENSADEHFPKFWYWMDDDELRERRAAQPPEWRTAPAPGPRRGLYPPAGREAVRRR